jgi:hypothetical protein
VKFIVTPAALAAFDSLKAAFTGNPVLAHLDPDLKSVKETHTLNFVSAEVLSQRHPE